MNKSIGDTLRLGGSVYRIVGIYETGDAFEDSGAVLALSDAQVLLGRPRQVNLFYIRLKDPALSERFQERVGRTWRGLAVSGVDEFSDQQTMADMLRALRLGDRRTGDHHRRRRHDEHPVDGGPRAHP